MAEAPSVQTPSTTDAGPPAAAIAASEAPPESPSTLLTAEDKAVVPGDKPDDKPVEVVIPDKYELTAPEGVEFDANLIEAISPVLKELKVDAAGAQKLADVVAQATKANQEKQATAAQEAKAKADADYSEWLGTEVRNNEDSVRKEWGAQFEENLSVSRRAVAKFADAPFKKILDETGLGSHPSVVKMFHAIGQMIRQDTPPPNSQVATQKSLEARLYPNMTQRAN